MRCPYCREASVEAESPCPGCGLPVSAPLLPPDTARERFRRWAAERQFGFQIVALAAAFCIVGGLAVGLVLGVGLAAPAPRSSSTMVYQPAAVPLMPPTAAVLSSRETLPETTTAGASGSVGVGVDESDPLDMREADEVPPPPPPAPRVRPRPAPRPMPPPHILTLAVRPTRRAPRVILWGTEGAVSGVTTEYRDVPRPLRSGG